MKDIAEVWAAYRVCASNPDATPEGRDAFWKELERHFRPEAVAGLRRAVEFFFAENLEDAASEDPTADCLELYALWGKGD